MKFCTDEGTFDPILSQRLFEGSIALFQSGFFNTYVETRSQFMSPNPSQCSVRGQSESQLQILSIQQLGNTQNDFDGNDNLDLVHYYINQKSPTNLTQFIGNIISFQRCAYVFNFQYDSTTSTKTYNTEVFTISIEYDSDLERKRTTYNKKGDYQYSMSNNSLGYRDFPCKVTEFYYHPGLNAIMYLLEDKRTLIIKADRSYTSTDIDPCSTHLFKDSSQIGHYKVDLLTLTTQSGWTATGILENFVFLNKQLYIVTHGYTSSNTNVKQSRFWKINLTITGQYTLTSSAVLLGTYDGEIDQLAAFELEGFVFTIPEVSGYYLAKIDLSTYSSITAVKQFRTGVYWKIYQSRVDNHMHRPIWGVNNTQPSAINRITTEAAEKFNDATNQTDFYNFNTQFARYHAVVLNPGKCGDPRDTTDYDNMRAIVINLRDFVIEKCIAQSLVGCGDAKLYFSNDEECDDGNLNDGDGCSGACKIEQNFNCTQVKGAQSSCVPVICGNLEFDDGEECDDGNFADGDGCSSTCKSEAGWDCSAFSSCVNMCGDGVIYQQVKIDENGDQYVFFTESCDGVEGCDNSTCTPVLGWTCTVDTNDWSSSCIQTCGDNQKQSWEVCDDGNNDSGDGCAQGCMEIEFPYQCPPVGKCSNSCGNGIFQGIDASIGYTTSSSNEECDDGNNVDGDGCTAYCTKEAGYTCVNKFLRLTYEIPYFKTVCTKSSSGGGNNTSNLVPQYYRQIYSNELSFASNGYYVSLSAMTGTFRLIEQVKDDKTLYGISFVDSIERQEYMKIQQLENNAVTYFELTTSGSNSQSKGSNYEAYQRGVFGPYYIRNINQNSFAFYGLLEDGNDVTFRKFFEVNNGEQTQYLGNHEIYWWPYTETILMREMNGLYWKGIKFVKDNVYQVSQSPGSFPQSQWIQSAFKKQFYLEGQLRVHPVFYQNYIISYISQSSSTGVLRVHKYHTAIDYLAPFNEEIVFTQMSQDYRKYSLVYFSSQFGIIFKMASSSALYRFSVTTMALVTSPSFVDNNLVDKPYSISDLVMIQRRMDPHNWELERPVYAYFTTGQAFYKLMVNTASNQIQVQEKISFNILGVDLNRALVDVGQYYLAVYSGANCNAVKNQTYLTQPSVWFYKFSTREWECMPLAISGSRGTFAWNIKL